MTIEGPPGSFLAPNYSNETPGSLQWADYELEFESMSTGPIGVLVRYKQGGKQIHLSISATPKFTKYLVKLEGVALYIYEDGKLTTQGIIDMQSGPPIFLISGGAGSLTLKGVKVKVNKTSK
jgi:hypothetical protein